MTMLWWEATQAHIGPATVVSPVCFEIRKRRESMTMYHWLYRLLAVLLLATLAACGGGQADAPAEEADAPAEEAETGTESEGGEVGGIPVYPGATLPESGSPLAQGMEAMQEQMQAMQDVDGISIEAEGYVLPEGTTFEDVQSFYDEELTGQGWETMSDFDETVGGAIPNGGMTGWMKSETEIFTVMVMEEPQSGSNFMLTSYATEN
jgi:predicted small lipoprotein YifL